MKAHAFFADINWSDIWYQRIPLTRPRLRPVRKLSEEPAIFDEPCDFDADFPDWYYTSSSRYADRIPLVWARRKNKGPVGRLSDNEFVECVSFI